MRSPTFICASAGTAALAFLTGIACGWRWHTPPVVPRPVAPGTARPAGPDDFLVWKDYDTGRECVTPPESDSVALSYLPASPPTVRDLYRNFRYFGESPPVAFGHVCSQVVLVEWQEEESAKQEEESAKGESAKPGKGDHR